jgi:hypothetical protein
VAKIIEIFGVLDAKRGLEVGREAIFTKESEALEGRRNAQVA